MVILTGIFVRKGISYVLFPLFFLYECIVLKTWNFHSILYYYGFKTKSYFDKMVIWMLFLQRGQIVLLSSQNIWPFCPENVEKSWQHCKGVTYAYKLYMNIYTSSQYLANNTDLKILIIYVFSNHKVHNDILIIRINVNCVH